MRDHVSAVLCQQVEQPVFLRRDRDPLTPDGDRAHLAADHALVAARPG